MRESHSRSDIQQERANRQRRADTRRRQQRCHHTLVCADGSRRLPGHHGKEGLRNHVADLMELQVHKLAVPTSRRQAELVTKLKEKGKDLPIGVSEITELGDRDPQEPPDENNKFIPQYAPGWNCGIICG